MKDKRPTSIMVDKNKKGVEITCMDDLSGSAIGINLPLAGYEALAEHFRTGAMETNSHYTNTQELFDYISEEVDATCLESNLQDIMRICVNTAQKQANELLETKGSLPIGDVVRCTTCTHSAINIANEPCKSCIDWKNHTPI
ncbi:MAG: hypothetical protein PF444_03100 [Bacteroidales bacterium]|jgi:hypothetical protein|nr:hypothetical protein [Bacteroidales bacterium]